jgi:hypothetical protein
MNMLLVYILLKIYFIILGTTKSLTIQEGSAYSLSKLFNWK